MGFIDQIGEVFYFSDKRYFTIGPLKESNDRFLAVKESHHANLVLKGIKVPDEDEMIPGAIWQLQFRPEQYEPSTKTVFNVPFRAVPWSTENGGVLRSLPKSAEYVSILLGPNGATIIVMGIGLLVGCAARWRGAASPTDLRIPILVILAALSLLATLFASVQREFRYPYDPLFAVLLVWAVSRIFSKNTEGLVFQNADSGKEPQKT